MILFDNIALFNVAVAFSLSNIIAVLAFWIVVLLITRFVSFFRLNPVKSVKIGATTISGSKFKSSSETSLSYAKFAGKKVKTTVTLAKGWKLDKLYIYSGNNPANGSMKPAIEYLQKGWMRSESVTNGSKIPVAGGKGFRIMFTAVNSKTGISEHMTIMLK